MSSMNSTAFRRVTWLILALLGLACIAGSAKAVAAQPILALPTPPGESWRVIQGYGCGTHEGWDYYALDLVSASGMSLGAPVRAAADGTLMAWVEESGTLILNHGDQLFTMYTHMEPGGLTQVGLPVQRGQLIGLVGERGTPGNPHLHFMAYLADGVYGLDNRRSIPLRFAEGYELPDIGGCNQHSGVALTAAGSAVEREGFSIVRRAPPHQLEPIYCAGFPHYCRQ